jgi:hypothetical protein
MVREPRKPANVAVELIIANAQQAIIDQEYGQAEALIEVLAEVLETGRVTTPVAAEYVAIVRVLAEEGYETLALELGEGEATADVTQSPPRRETISLEKDGDGWQLLQP